MKSQSTDQLVDAAVREVCSAVDLDPPGTDAITFDESGLPSLQMATLVISLEARLGREFSDGDLALANWRSPAAIKAFLSGKPVAPDPT